MFSCVLSFSSCHELLVVMVKGGEEELGFGLDAVVLGTPNLKFLLITPPQ